MISLRAIQLLLKYFDGIDQALSARLSRKHPWPEEALTAVFCDLMDGETQEEEGVSYGLSSLYSDFAKADDPLSVNIRIDTHQYSKQIEHHVTQSDVGIVVRYENQFDSSASSTRYWLFQAKRLFPIRNTVPAAYELKSCYSSRNAAQESRMRRLNELVGFDFVQYLLYCPRPSALPSEVRQALSQLRTMAMSQNIFDYALGLQLRQDLISDAPTTAAGIFVAPLDNCPGTLAETHQNIFTETTPFSWFLIQHFTNPLRGGPFQRRLREDPHRPKEPIAKNAKIAERLVRGDPKVLEELDLPSEGAQGDARILPAHTIEVRVVCGLDRPRNG
jgi:hypothetical protein